MANRKYRSKRKTAFSLYAILFRALSISFHIFLKAIYREHILVSYNMSRVTGPHLQHCMQCRLYDYIPEEQTLLPCILFGRIRPWGILRFWFIIFWARCPIFHTVNTNKSIWLFYSALSYVCWNNGSHLQPKYY